MEIRKKFRELLNLGFIDTYRFKNDKNKNILFGIILLDRGKKNFGMRIDHFLLTNSLIENISSIKINKKPRAKNKPSDHTPIELEIN